MKTSERETAGAAEDGGYAGLLRRAMEALWNEEEGTDLYDLIETLFRGVLENGKVYCPVEFDPARQSASPVFLEDGDGTKSLCMSPFPEMDGWEPAAPFRMREIVRILRGNDGCTGLGLMLGNGKEYLRIPRGIILTALDAGYRLATDEIEAEAEALAGILEENPKAISFRRPVSGQEFRKIEERVRAFDRNPEDFLVMNLAHDPELQFIQVLRCGTEGRRSLQLGFDMGDYGWEHPLILEKEMPAEEAVRLLRRICAEGESPEQIAADCGFRDIGNPWEEEPEETD